MAKAITVRIIGDAESYSRSLKQAEGSTSRFGAGMKKLGPIMATAGAAAGFAALEIGKKSVEAAIAAQEANDKLSQALKNQKIQMVATSPAILELEASARKLGFANDETRAGLTKLIQSGKSYGQSAREMTAAQDLARAKSISLGDATTALIRLQAGNTRAAKEFGVVLAPVTAAVDKLKASKIDLTTAEGKHALALAKVQDKLATGGAYYDAVTAKVQGQGQAFASTAAGGIAQFHAGIADLEEKIGTALLPAVTKLVDVLNANLPAAIAATTTVMNALKPVFDATKIILLEMVTPLRVIIDLINGDWTKAWNDLKKPVADAVSLVSSTFGGVAAGIANAVQDATNAARNFGAGILTGMKNGILGFADWVWTRAQGAINYITQELANALNSATEFGATILRGLKAGILGFADFVFGRVTDAIQWLIDKATAAFTQASAFGGKIYSGLKSGLTDVIKLVTGPLQAAIDWLGDQVKGAENAARALGGAIYNGIKAGLAPIISFLKGVLDVIHEIMSLGGILGGSTASPPSQGGSGGGGGGGGARAKGGPVSRGLSYLVGERGPELFVPGRSGRIVPSAGLASGGANINITVYAETDDPNKLARAIVEPIRRELLRTQTRNGTLGFT